MTLRLACGPSLAALLMLASCTPDLQEPAESSPPSSPSGRAAATTDVVVTPGSVVRDVQGRKMTFNYSVYDRLQGVVASFTVSSLTSTGSPVLARLGAADRSVNLDLAGVLALYNRKQKRRGSMLTSTLRVLPEIKPSIDWPDLTPTPADFVVSPLRPSKLTPGQGLFPSECMDSPGLAYRLCMEADGNLVERNDSSVIVWQTVRGTSGPSTLLLSASGEFSTLDAAGTSTWSTAGTWTSFSLLSDGRRQLERTTWYGLSIHKYL